MRREYSCSETVRFAHAREEERFRVLGEATTNGQTKLPRSSHRFKQDVPRDFALLPCDRAILSMSSLCCCLRRNQSEI